MAHNMHKLVLAATFSLLLAGNANAQRSAASPPANSTSATSSCTATTPCPVQNSDNSPINGTDPTTGVTAPPSGTGTRGWLAAILSKLNAGLAPDTRATGQTINSATANAAVLVSLNNGQATAGFTVSGLTASGATLTAESSNDGGTTWNAVNTTAPATGALSTTVTTDGQFRVNAAGHAAIRLRVSTAGAGTITVAYSAASATGLVALSAPLPAGSNSIGSVTPVPYSGTPGPCVTATIGTTATMLLDSVASGNATSGRAGGGLVVPTSGGAIEYQWANSGTGLTTTPGGIVYQVIPGGSIPFGGAPNSQLWAIGTVSQTVSCSTGK